MVFAYEPLLPVSPHLVDISLCACSAGTALFSDGYANGVIGNGV
jgi:hypothetical protein